MSGLEWFGLVSGIIGLLGTIFGVWTYFRSKRRRELTWSVEHNQIIEGSKSDIPGLKIMFEDEEIPSLRSILLTIKNTGNEDIVRKDILQPIVFSVGLEEAQLLNVRLLDEETVKPNEYKLGPEGTAVNFEFHHMLKKDSARIQILHTAATDPDIQLSEKSKIRDGKTIDYTQKQKKLRKLKRYVFYLGMSMLILGALVFAIVDTLVWGTPLIPKSNAPLGMKIASRLFSGLGVLMVYLSMMKESKEP